MRRRGRAAQHRYMTTLHTPADAASAVLHNPVVPDGDDERFVGFGVMGLPFANGHYLALRHFPATTFSPGYRSVWPDGIWTFYATTPGPQSCARYFSSATPRDAVQCGIDVAWLLLTLGLEFSATEFAASLRHHLPSAGVDAVLNATPGAVAGWLLGFDGIAILALAGVTLHLLLGCDRAPAGGPAPAR
jgi:hypothetical protein